MTPFEKFYSENWENFDIFNMSPKQRLRAAFEAGQASRPSVITAYELKARLVNDITEHDLETQAMIDHQEKMGNRKAAQYIRSGRQYQAEPYHNALMVVIQMIQSMEMERTEREAQS